MLNVQLSLLGDERSACSGAPYPEYGITQVKRHNHPDLSTPEKRAAWYPENIAKTNARIRAAADKRVARKAEEAESKLYDGAGSLDRAAPSEVLWGRYLKLQQKNLEQLSFGFRSHVATPLTDEKVLDSACSPERWVLRWCVKHPGQTATAVPQDYCGTKSCPICCKLRDRKQMKRTMERFAGGHIQRFIITYPQELRALVDWEQVKLMSKLWAVKIEQFLRKVNNLDDSWQLGLEDWIHPEGDKEPGVWKPHHNFLVRGEAFKVNIDDVRNLFERRELRLMLTKAELAEFRGIISEVLRTALGYKKVCRENFWYSFVGSQADSGKRTHFVRYTSRAFPRWAHLPGLATRRYRIFQRGWPAIRAYFNLREDQEAWSQCPVKGCEVELSIVEMETADARKKIKGMGVHVGGLTGPPRF